MTKNQIEKTLKIIETTIKQIENILQSIGYKPCIIEPREFYEYITGETPTGDTVTLEEILQKEYYMIHEVVEICELKKMKIPINKTTIIKYHPQVYKAHLEATEWELRIALEKGDIEWIKTRLKHAEDRLNDESLSKELKPRCRNLIQKYSKFYQGNLSFPSKD